MFALVSSPGRARLAHGQETGAIGVVDPHHFEGHQYFYTGQGRGPLLFVFQGNTASSVHVQPQLEHFSQRYRAVALDFLGTGRSDRLECWPVDWWRQAGRAAAALARHLGEERWVSLGMSGGSTVALWQAIDFPDQVRAVVADSEGERYSPEDLRAVAAGRNLEDPMSQQFWSMGHGPDWRQVVLADNDLLLRFAAAGGNHYGGRLKEVRCPVLFTGSLQDEFIRDLGEQTLSMLRQVQGSQAFLTNAGGHPLMWTCPDLFYREVDGFLG